jgi:enamine deaminase RidA (YjgF/YER057c/UK114 family)
VQQRPLDGGTLAMFAYHIKTADNPFGQSVYKHTKNQLCREVFTTGRNYSLLWTTNCTDGSVMDSRIQTDKIFDGLNSVLNHHQMDLRQNMVRTWIYVRDIDNNYAGMVRSRCELFDNIGLTAQTRYIASTGIEGKTFNPVNLVTLDSLSIGNLKEEQIIKMEALENLSSTAAYGVTFERGLRVRFGDRSHLYISGTASIDKCGNIMYEGDVRKQLERTLDNVEALLAPHGATMNDMQYIFLYLRNPGHFSLISDILSNRIPEGLPLIAVEGPVCRPGWLVEVEGVGIIPDSCAFPDFI